MARLISYNHQTNDYRQCCHVENMAEHCRLGLFQDSDFVCLEVEHLFPSVGRARIKQTSVSHSSTESEVISLYAGLRMDEIPTLDQREVVIDVSHSSKNTHTHSHQAVGDRCRKGRRASTVKPGTRRNPEHKSSPKKSLQEAVTETLMNCQKWITLSQAQVLQRVMSATIFFVCSTS